MAGIYSEITSSEGALQFIEACRSIYPSSSFYIENVESIVFASDASITDSTQFFRMFNSSFELLVKPTRGEKLRVVLLVENCNEWDQYGFHPLVNSLDHTYFLMINGEEKQLTVATYESKEYGTFTRWKEVRG